MNISEILKKLRFPIEEKFYNDIYTNYFDGDMLLDIYRKSIKKFLPELKSKIFFEMFKVTENTAPELFNTFLEVMDKLNLSNGEIEFYLTSNQEINAFAFTVNKILTEQKPAIILNAGLVKTLNKEEMKHVIGHEIAHIMYGHSILRFIFFEILKMPEKSDNIMILKFLNLFQHWEQLSEISADRVGLYVVDESESAIRSLIKLTHGLPEELLKIDVNEVMEEIDEIISDNDNFFLPSSHPSLIMRIKLLETQANSNFFKELRDGKIPQHDDSIEKMKEFLSMIVKRPSNIMFQVETDFLEILGLLVMLADGKITKDEYEYLSGLIAFNVQFPYIPEIGKDISPEDFHELIQQLIGIIKTKFPERAEVLFDALVRVSLADKEFTREEYNVLFDIGKAMELPESRIASIILENISKSYLPLK